MLFVSFVVPILYRQPRLRRGSRANRNRDLNVLVEAVENGHQPVDGEPVELHLADAGEVGRGAVRAEPLDSNSY